MRHDWTLLCTEVSTQDTGALGLGNVFSSLQVTSPYGNVANAESILFDPPAILVSHWTAEFDSDRRLYSAIVQLIAPGGEDVLWEDRLDIDVRDNASFLLMYVMPNLEFVGLGAYEFHVFLDAFGPIGEWGRACLTISE